MSELYSEAGIARFWSKVQRNGPDECWPWLGSTSRKNYGGIRIDGRRCRSPRVAWEIANDQPISPGLFACHRCDNPICVNPAHIWIGTPKENMRDCAAKKRLGGFVAVNQAKEVCSKGHPLTPDNICRFSHKLRERRCRTCFNEYTKLRNRARRAAKRLAAAPKDVKGGDL